MPRSEPAKTRLMRVVRSTCLLKLRALPLSRDSSSFRQTPGRTADQHLQAGPA